MQSVGVAGPRPAPSWTAAAKLIVAAVVVIFALTLVMSFNFGGNPAGFTPDLLFRLLIALIVSVPVAALIVILQLARRNARRA